MAHAPRALLSRATWAAPVEAIALRSLYVRVKPAPINLSERRAVLAALKQHALGDLQVFKQLQDPSSFIAVVKTSTRARLMVSRCPLQFDHIPERSGVHPDPRVLGSGAATASPTDDAADADADADAGGPTSDGGEKTFTIGASLAPGYQHHVHIEQSPLHGPWPGRNYDARPGWQQDPRPVRKDDPLANATFATETLRSIIPNMAGSSALADWEIGVGAGGIDESLSPRIPASARISSSPDAAAAAASNDAVKMDHIRRRKLRQASRDEITSLLGGAEDGSAAENKTK
ncbi:hypothetical protein B0T24DRAFT_593574 [Lasiosphaeria ovina]|uniref:Uncharacterized protein n=1 Tax=Lasiosphaeria ovina TaxID=92902 RepID=A0AAE0N7V5_9PEZI|nr:hypothetical protein B0T24DRAFT_593574 [Lasiosphaeria ovina]